MKVFGKIVKYLILLCILAIVGFMGIRSCQTSDQSPLSELSPALEALPDGEILQFKQTDPLSDDGVLYAYAVYYHKDSGVLQVTVRYSNRLFARIQEKHPEFTRDDISFTVSGANETETLWECSGKKIDETDKYIYHYEQYVFEGVSFENVETIYANIHFDVEGVAVPSSVGIWYNVDLDEVYKK
ncbi:MAG: hypothetical protein IJY12_01210 [Clostridia bacterium]|nr:hypothetical protein [Clostridia bacterium]